MHNELSKNKLKECTHSWGTWKIALSTALVPVPSSLSRVYPSPSFSMCPTLSANFKIQWEEMKEREIKAENDREISIHKALSASNECIHPKLILWHKGWKDFFFSFSKKKYFYDRVMNQNTLHLKVIFLQLSRPMPS